MAFRLAPRFTVQVTKENIEGAVQNNSRSCAIACSLSDLGATRPKVDGRGIAFTMNGERFIYQTPVSASHYLREFDRNKKNAKPFTLRLSFGIARLAKRMGGKDRTEHTRHNSGGRKARKGFTGTRIVLRKYRVNGFEETASK